MSGTEFKRVTEWALDLLFPRRCPVCGKVTGAEGVCPGCRKKIPYIKGPKCFRCGRPVRREEEEYCGTCRERAAYFVKGRALCAYQGPVKEAMHAVKYQNKREYLDFFADEMEKQLGAEIKSWGIEALLPIPMYPADKHKRGYNQAELLAKKLGARLGLPVAAHSLHKRRRTADQKELNFRERSRNLKGAFTADPIPWERVLLIDDIYTTGSTVNEAAKTLLAAGAREVYAAVVCAVPEQ